jgi:hypothetical protein
VTAGRISRRGFLALAGSGAALATLGRLPASALSAASGAAPGGAAFFAPGEADVLLQVMERIVDSGLPDAPRVRDSGALAAIDRLCLSLDPELVKPLPWLLQAVEWGPWLFDLSFARFTTLSDAEKDASLRGWMTSRLALRRLGFQALKNLSLLGWYSQEASWAAIGYAGPLIARAEDGR